MTGHKTHKEYTVAKPTNFSDLEDLVADLAQDAQEQEGVIDDACDMLQDAFSELQATVDEAQELLVLANDWLWNEKIDQDEFDTIEGYVNDVMESQSDARQEVRDSIA